MDAKDLKFVVSATDPSRFVQAYGLVNFEKGKLWGSDLLRFAAVAAPPKLAGSLPSSALIATFRDHTGEVEISSDGESLTFSQESSHVRVALCETNKDLRLPKIPTTGFRKLPSGFVEALDICSVTTAKDPTKTQLCCVLLRGQTVLSTDRRSVTEVTLPKPLQTEKKGVLVHHSLVKFFPFLEESTEYAMTPEWFILRSGNRIGGARIVSGVFPDVSKILRQPFTEVAEFDIPENLVDSLKRHYGVQSAFNVDASVAFAEIKIAGSSMEVSSKIEGVLEFQERVTFKKKGRAKLPAIQIRVNPRVLCGRVVSCSSMEIGNAKLGGGKPKPFVRMKGDRVIQVVATATELEKDE